VQASVFIHPYERRGAMRKIVVLSMITLDGVLQAPGGPKEDASGGFKYGGWVAPYGDEVLDKILEEELKPAEYLLGRKTFRIWENYWPAHADFWPGINDGTKYVLSRTVKKSDWKNSVFLKGLADIKRLKSSKGPDIQVWGSGELIQLLLKNDLVDELRLKIYPLTLGKGKKLFDDGVMPSAFALIESLVTPSGVIVATYRRAGKVKTGTVGA
jgi:dihydrofolate reductase